MNPARSERQSAVNPTLPRPRFSLGKGFQPELSDGVINLLAWALIGLALAFLFCGCADSPTPHAPVSSTDFSAVSGPLGEAKGNTKAAQVYVTQINKEGSKPGDERVLQLSGILSQTASKLEEAERGLAGAKKEVSLKTLEANAAIDTGNQAIIKSVVQEDHINKLRKTVLYAALAGFLFYPVLKITLKLIPHPIPKAIGALMPVFIFSLALLTQLHASDFNHAALAGEAPHNAAGIAKPANLNSKFQQPNSNGFKAEHTWPNKNATQRLLTVLRTQVGVHEQPLGSNRGPEVDAFNRAANADLGSPWCGAVQAWAFDQCKLSRPDGAAYSPTWFPTSKRVAGTTLRAGDQFGLFFVTMGRIGHVGTVEDVRRRDVVTLEGNTNFMGSREGTHFMRKIRSKDACVFARWVETPSSQAAKIF